MPANRIGFSSDFVLVNQQVGIGTTLPAAKLQVVGTIKGDFNVSGATTFTLYSGFIPEFQNISVPSTIGIITTGIGTFVEVDEKESGFVSLTGDFTTLSEDLIVDEGKIFEVSTTNITGITTLGTQEVYAPDDSVVSVGTLESVSIQSHFSVPNGGSSNRPNQPVEGMVRFNDDLNTLEFYNGIEWRQFTVSGASGRGVFGGGYSPSVSSTIDYINISSTGNAINFGVLTVSRGNLSSCSSNIRGVFGGGTGPYTNTIDYITVASHGNAITFGTLSTANRGYLSACSSSTRGLFGGGYTTSPNSIVNVIDYIQFSTLGNALDFGDLSQTRYAASACSSTVRGVWGGGYASPLISNTMDYITIASTGNAVNFGSLTQVRRVLASCSSSTRGVFGGGNSPTIVNTLDYITISTTGNASDFGDLTVPRVIPSATSSQIRGVFGGGQTPTLLNTIDYITITSTGNATDFGDLTSTRIASAGCSDSHGGLGGF
jgi:hypothetical protein